MIIARFSVPGRKPWESGPEWKIGTRSAAPFRSGIPQVFPPERKLALSRRPFPGLPHLLRSRLRSENIAKTDLLLPVQDILKRHTLLKP